MTLPKTPEGETARLLVVEHGLKVALRRAVSGRLAAKRARSRKAFQYWSAVVAEIESLGRIADSSNGNSAIERSGRGGGLNAK
jgi:hypothetical protein